jgi:hypothetical protein
MRRNQTLCAFFAVSIIGCSLPTCLAQGSDAGPDAGPDGGDQSAPVYRQPKRLGRPGGQAATGSSDAAGGDTSASSGRPLKGGAQPFSLGVQEQHQGDVPEPLHAGAMNEAFPNVNTPLQSGTGQNDGGSNSFSLSSAQNGSNIPTVPITTAKILANFDVELIVDQSTSMRMPDCPNFMSRWDWCGMQAHDLASQLSPFTPKGLTITNFNDGYQVHTNSSPQNIADLFAGGGLGMGTRLAEPLSDRLNNYFAHRRPGSKPLLIAIITDGEPTPHREPAMVADALIDASRKMLDPHELTIVFFQIGGFDLEGRAFIQDLDNNLVGYGAKYDLVRSVRFEQLKQVGLASALVNSIQDFAKEQTHSVAAPIGNSSAPTSAGGHVLHKPVVKAH